VLEVYFAMGAPTILPAVKGTENCSDTLTKGLDTTPAISSERA
jgi:hypothetical protein